MYRFLLESLIHCRYTNYPAQRNYDDCGVFTLVFMSQLAVQAPPHYMLDCASLQSSHRQM